MVSTMWRNTAARLAQDAPRVLAAIGTARAAARAAAWRRAGQPAPDHHIDVRLVCDWCDGDVW